MIEVDQSDRDHLSRGSDSDPKPSGSSLGPISMPKEQPGPSEVMGLGGEDDVEAQLNKDSSDNIELYVPSELMNSLLE